MIKCNKEEQVFEMIGISKNLLSEYAVITKKLFDFIGINGVLAAFLLGLANGEKK